MSKNKKNLICLIFTISIFITSENRNVFSNEKVRVITTFTIIGDIAKNIAGERAIVESITKPGVEIHNYKPTPKDILRTQKADIILWNGLNLEQWFLRFFSYIDNIPSVVVSEGIEPLSIFEGEYTGKPNPHAWMSTKNALIYVKNIYDALVEIDPKNQEYYSNNASKYSKKILRIQDEIRKKLEFIEPSNRFLVTSEGAFSYLAKDLGMKEIYLWPMNSDRQGSPQQIRKVIDIIVKQDIPVIFSESTVSDKPAKQIASETNAIYGGVLYVDSLSKDDGIVPSYLELLRVTTDRIASAFKKALKE
jgi:manganese/iron transport system substrate-binding protein